MAQVIIEHYNNQLRVLNEPGYNEAPLKAVLPFTHITRVIVVKRCSTHTSCPCVAR
jgi:hypothetical protein